MGYFLFAAPQMMITIESLKAHNVFNLNTIYLIKFILNVL